ncbi:unnamed protein product [Ectocarpus sp. 12 AP-2014]
MALDRFLHHEIEPAAQRIFDAAVLDHTEACRLLDGKPVPAFDGGGAQAASSKHQQEGRGVEGRQGAVTGGEFDRPRIIDFTGDASGGGGSYSARSKTVPGRRRLLVEDNSRKREFQEKEGGGGHRGGSRGSQGERAVAAGSGGFAGDDVLVGAASCGRRERQIGGGGGVVATAAAAAAAAAAAKRSDDLEEEDDDLWDAPLPGRLRATDISAKIVGLSSEIRRRAEADAGREGHRKQ